ncbi:MAG TPA: response regulator transcription factor [Anaerolineales bacterium]|nr:response regulator transcription factor [Anaerolineales bacterium]
MTIKVFICDDHDILRKGLRSLLETATDIEVIGEASDGETAIRMVSELKPDVVLMDLLMPGMGGVEAIRQIRVLSPSSRIFVLSSSHEDELVVSSIRAGATGYLVKTSSPDVLTQGIRDLAAGNSVLPPDISSKLISAMQDPKVPNATLTHREVDVLKLISEGLSNKDISEVLEISENTVISHVGRILNKLELENRTQAALYARKQGLVR